MKTLKVILIIIWAFITFGLVIYSQMMKTEAVRQGIISKELREVTKEMSNGLTEYYENMVLLRNDTINEIEIDSLIENSDFLKESDEERQKDITD